MPLSSSPPTIPRRVLVSGWILVAALPLLYIAYLAIIYSRNIIFWDEFDTALALILRIDAGAGWRELMDRFFAINNEHRTVTSRLMFAASYWLTGTVNFHVIGAMGNLFLPAACAILVLALAGWERRIRMAVLLAFLMFQLEHFESFLWSGSSIDHFQVITLSVGAIAALAHRTRAGFTFAALLGLLANFTLAHGTLVWPIGAALLWQQRRWRHLAAWGACSAGVIAMFLHGFEFNPGHQISDIGGRSLTHVVVYWLALLGAPLTFGGVAYAAWLGAGLLVGLGIVALGGAMSRAPAAFFSALFAVGALGMVAVGRTAIAGTEINSRYLVLGALAWALLLFLALDLVARPQKPLRELMWLMPALAAFNIGANLKFAPLAEGYIEVRDRAATSFMQYGEDGRGLTRLHPQERHADILLKMAAERGVYRLPSVSHLASFPAAEPNPKIITYFDELVVNDRATTLGGWAMLPGQPARRGQIHVVLRSATSMFIFSTVTLLRPDVAKAYGEPTWRRAGFRAVIERSRLPAEDFDVGVLLARGSRTEYLMTGNRLLLGGGKPASVVHVTAP